MRTPMLIPCALAILPWLALVDPSCAQEVRIVSPPGQETVEGNVSGGVPTGPTRIQFLIPAADFSALPDSHHQLKSVSWRPDASSGPLTTSTADLTLRLSTTDVAELNLKFDDNHGTHITTVVEGPIEWSTDQVPGSGPKPFDYRVEFDTPFFYDPEMGNLLVDLTVSGFSPPNARVDSHRFEDPAILSQFGDPGSEIATQGDPVAGVLEFTFVPEPSTFLLVSVAALMLAYPSRRTRTCSR